MTCVSLPAKFVRDRMFLCPTTKNGVELALLGDTAGASFMKPDVAQSIGLFPVRQTFPNEGEFDVVPFPEFEVDKSIPTDSGLQLFAVRNDAMDIDGMLGMTWFADRVWIFDYLNNKVVQVQDRNEEKPWDGHVCELSFLTDDKGISQLSFPRVQAAIDGDVIDFLFDTGATLSLSNEAMECFNDGLPRERGTCFIVHSIFDSWRTRHPDWIVIENADTLANDPIIRVPTVSIAGHDVGPVWFTCRNDENFQRFSRFMDKPVNGALGGSLFRYFSIYVDYPQAVAYFRME